MHRFVLNIILSACFLLVPGWFSYAQTAEEEAYLEELLAARHLPKYMHQDIDSGLSELVNNPSPYLTLIDNNLVFPGDGALDTYSEFQERYSRMIGLLETIGTEEARQIMERVYLDVVEDMLLLNASYEAALTDGTGEEQRLALSRDADAAYSLLVSVFYTFKRLEDNRILDDALTRFESFNYVTQLVVIQYNNAVGEGEIAESTVNTVEGWQVVGMPVEPLDNAYTSVYSETELNGPPYRWTAEGYETVSELTMGQAYWINVQTPGMQRILGRTMTTVEFPDALNGWNNLAGPGCDYPVSDLLNNHPEISPDQVYEWQAEDGYVQLREGDFISQGSGFWVFLTSAATLTLTCPETGAVATK